MDVKSDCTSDCTINDYAQMKTRIFKKLTPYAYTAPTIILLVVLMVIPICMVIYYSFFDNVIATDTSTFVGMTHYKNLLSNSKFGDAVLHTTIFVILSTLFHIVLGITFAMMLNSKLISRVTKSTFRVIYILPWVFTAAIVATIWRIIFNPNGVLNYLLRTVGLISERITWLSDASITLYVLIFINIWSGYPFFMTSILAGLQSISQDIYEAAKVDGANGIQKFFWVTLPQLKPILVSMTMLDCIWTTQQFSLVWMLTGGGPVNSTDVLGTYTYRLAFKNYNFSEASACAGLILIVILILSIFYVRLQHTED